MTPVGHGNTEELPELDFDTGKLQNVGPGSRIREWILLIVLLLMTSLPWVLGAFWNPAIAAVAFLTLAIGKAMVGFVASAQAGTAHHIRFLLSGNNPLGMTGAASMMLGAVDSYLDWQEDSAARRKSPLTYGCATAARVLVAPMGVVLFVGELTWDALLGRGPRMWYAKCHEFFVIARYHDLICPERSNDLFYPDLAYARYTDNILLYQWHRLRAMVFELQQYRLDVENRVGAPCTNLFRVGDVTAFLILQRLKLSTIQRAVRELYADQPELFPLPRRVSDPLVARARPLDHYLQMYDQLNREGRLPPNPTEFECALARIVPRPLIWHLLYLLAYDEPYELSHPVLDGRVKSPIEANEKQMRRLDHPQAIDKLQQARILDTQGRITGDAKKQIECILDRHCTPITADEHKRRMNTPIPSSWKWGDGHFAFADHDRKW